MSKRKLAPIIKSCQHVPTAKELAEELRELRNVLAHEIAIPEDLISQIQFRLAHLQWHGGTDEENDLVRARVEDLLVLSVGRGISIPDSGHIPAQRVATIFRFLELFSHILPPKVRMEAFEPAYHDAKADYLASCRRYQGKIARLWLVLCFGLHVTLMMSQCVWGTFGDKLRRALTNSLPEVFRKFFGS